MPKRSSKSYTPALLHVSGSTVGSVLSGWDNPNGDPIDDIFNYGELEQ